jgi:hypothetical protein
MGPRRSRGRRFAVVTATVALAVGLGACAGSDPAPGTTGEGAAVTDRPVEHSTLGCDQWEGSDIVVAGDGGRLPAQAPQKIRRRQSGTSPPSKDCLPARTARCLRVSGSG